MQQFSGIENRLPQISDFHILSVPANFTLISLQVSCDYVCKGGFTCPVFSHQPCPFAFLQVQGDGFQYLIYSKILFYIYALKQQHIKITPSWQFSTPLLSALLASASGSAGAVFAKQKNC